VSVSRLLAALGERRLMQGGGFVMGACLIVISLRLAWPFEFVNFAVLGFGFYMLHAVIQIYASELSPKARGSAMALHSFFFFLGQAVGPIIYGIGHNSIGIGPVLIFGAAVLAAVGLTCAHWLRRKPDSAASTA
jgi:predicted MFS family arabinose efflux permease